MLSFENDYAHGAHEKILQRMLETNREPASGYGCVMFDFIKGKRYDKPQG